MRHNISAAEQPNAGPVSALPKSPTGIQGLDEITGGGLPRGRPTLLCGGAGCGKTLMATEFLVRGAREFGEPGLFVSFEEQPAELAQNVASLGFDLDELVRQRHLMMDHVRVERSEIDETGDYDLEALFIRLGYGIDSIGAKRVVLDTIETLFSGLTNHGVLRAELRRLFRWLKDKDVTAVITCERGDGTLTRHGLEEYVSDCVILLDHRVSDQISTRRLRIVKYRGSSHGMDEYPFLVTEHGISVIPMSSMGLTHQASDERISSGVPALDTVLGGGIYRGSTVMVTGTAGTGKTSLAAAFARSVADGGEACLYMAFEESPDQLKRNMRSIGIDLAEGEKKGLIHFHATRPSLYGLEMHLSSIYQLVRDHQPKAVVLDPISNLIMAGNAASASAMLMRLVDFLKMDGITAFLTSLTPGTAEFQADIGVSSMVDTWMLIRGIERDGRRERGLYVLKSRGTAHSNAVHDYTLTDDGIVLGGVMNGSNGTRKAAGAKRVRADGHPRSRTRQT
jgi:circadian clock protein KaiC